MKEPSVWVFNGPRTGFPSGVFHTKDEAEAWIQANGLSGTLTQYPVGLGVYDWAVQEGYFKPKKPEHATPEFIQSFSSATQPHEHYDADK